MNLRDGWSRSNLQIDITERLVSGSAASPLAREGDVLTSEIVWPFIHGTRLPAGGIEDGLRRQDGSRDFRMWFIVSVHWFGRSPPLAPLGEISRQRGGESLSQYMRILEPRR